MTVSRRPDIPWQHGNNVAAISLQVLARNSIRDTRATYRGRSILPLFWLDVIATKLAMLACMQGRGSHGPVNLVRRMTSSHNFNHTFFTSKVCSTTCCRLLLTDCHLWLNEMAHHTSPPVYRKVPTAGTPITTCHHHRPRQLLQILMLAMLFCDRHPCQSRIFRFLCRRIPLVHVFRYLLPAVCLVAPVWGTFSSATPTCTNFPCLLPSQSAAS